MSPCPTISRRLFLTRKCCHLPPPWGSLHASLPGLGQGSPNLLARPRLLLLASCLPPLPFGPPKGNSDHLLQPGPKWDPRPPRSDNSCQSFQCLFECHFLRETFREPPASVPTETRIHVSCVYHAVRVWQDSVPPLRALLPPQPWCVGSLAKQRLFVGGDLTQGEWATLALKALFSLGTLSSEGRARPPVPALPPQWAPERGWTLADLALRLRGARPLREPLRLLHPQ